MKREEGRLHGLEWRLEGMRRLWQPAADPHAPFVEPPPPPPAPPPPLYQGEIDQPAREPAPPRTPEELALVDAHAADPTRPTPPPEPPVPPTVVEAENVNVNGWATFRAGPTASVEVFFEDTALGKARLAVPRGDVASIVREPYVAVSGWELDVAVAPLLAGATERTGELRAVAIGAADGERHELEPVTVTFRLPVADDGPADLGAPLEATPPPTFAGRGGPRTLVVTHQLTLGGAQLLLMDLVREQLAAGLIDPILVSTMDGPLRGELEELGVPVHITSLVPPDKLGSYRGRMEEFVAWSMPVDAELILVNTATATTLPAADIATALGVPSVWLIHESFEPAVNWAVLGPEVRAHAEIALGSAARAVFEADATRRVYEGRLIAEDRCRTIPYGLALETIDAERAEFDNAAARRRHGVPEDARLVVCVGTVEPRKAQIPLAMAFDLIGAAHPQSRLAFVGGRPGDEKTIALEETVAASPRRDQVEVIPITPDVADWYAMADLLVCASDVESLPRTVLEAMAWGTPVLATSIFGLPELIEDGKTGWLCETRDVRALADALDRALGASAATYESIATAARTLVETRHSSRHYAEEMAKVYAEALAAPLTA
jgi:D-inositol-3-phosphate glycosyltransferase